MEVTIRIKLINRFKPLGIDDYKRKPAMKLPVHARTGTKDNLNCFCKTIKVDPNRIKQDINEEISRIIAREPNFQIKRDPDFGDKLIGEIDVWEYDDWCFTCFVPVSSNKSKSEKLPHPEKVEDKSQLKLFEY